MSQQVKIPAEVKREVELCSAITGKTQGELLANAWHEYRKANQAEFAEGLRWAQAVLASPSDAAVAASGMPAEDLSEITEAFGSVGSVEKQASRT
jgi:hypothetical protein